MLRKPESAGGYSSSYSSFPGIVISSASTEDGVPPGFRAASLIGVPSHLHPVEPPRHHLLPRPLTGGTSLNLRYSAERVVRETAHLMPVRGWFHRRVRVPRKVEPVHVLILRHRPGYVAVRAAVSVQILVSDSLHVREDEHPVMSLVGVP